MKLFFLLCFLIFESSLTVSTAYCQSYSIPSLRVYKKGDSSLYIPLQYIDSIVHYNIVTPTLITGSAQSITRNSAYIGAKVTSDGGGTISQTGFCWSTKEEPTINSAVKYSEDFKNLNFSVELLGLSKNTKYFVRAFAINEVGISYGNQVEFTTVNSSDIVIIDGQEYNVITLGGKCFENSQLKVLEENLKVTKYANGDSIRYVRNKDEMIDAMNKQEGAYCYYNFDPSYDSIYGKMYNRYAVQDIRGLSPLGWHVLHFQELLRKGSLYNDLLCGGTMKSIGTVESKDGLWSHPNVEATNESGFNGHPGGVVIKNEFKHIGKVGFWWGNLLSSWILDHDPICLVNQDIKIYWGGSGFYEGVYPEIVSFASVRCTKD